MSDGFFVTDLPYDLWVGGQVHLTGREAHHAAVVRRIRVGEEVTVTDGQGRGVLGLVVSADPAHVSVEVAKIVSQPVRRPAVTVVQALPKKDRAELAVDLMTEVGVDHIIPWQATRSIVKWTPDRAEASRLKWVAVAREASKQARRLTFPTIDELATTSQVAEMVRTTAHCFVMHETATKPVVEANLAGVEQCLIIIGPEGGLTDQEVDLFTTYGGQTWSLGPTVLRTSTAGAVAITQLRTLWQAAQLPKVSHD